MVEANNLLLGLGKLYLKRSADPDGAYRLVGALKDKVEFTYKPEIVKQKAGEVMGSIRADRINEEATLKAQVCDFKVEQLIPLLGLTVSTTALTVTNSIRRVEEHVEPRKSCRERTRIGTGVVDAVREQEDAGIAGGHPRQLSRRYLERERDVREAARGDPQDGVDDLGGLGG